MEQQPRRNREAELNRMLTAKLKLRMYAYKVVASFMQKRGLPDHIACCNGRFVALETKVVEAPTAKPSYSKTQLIQLQAIRESGGLSLGLVYCTRLKRWRVDETFEHKKGEEYRWVPLSRMLDMVTELAVVKVSPE